MSEWQDPGGELPAGRDLDARVALALWPEMRVFRHTSNLAVWLYGRTPESAECPLPHFSTDANTALKVAAHMRDRGGWWWSVACDNQGLVDACFWREIEGTGARKNHWATAEGRYAAAEAICRAALKALGYMPRAGVPGQPCPGVIERCDVPAGQR